MAGNFKKWHLEGNFSIHCKCYGFNSTVGLGFVEFDQSEKYHAHA